MQDFQKYIYLDNAATTFPKAPGVKEAVNVFLENLGQAQVEAGIHYLLNQEGFFFKHARL